MNYELCSFWCLCFLCCEVSLKAAYKLPVPAPTCNQHLSPVIRNGSRYKNTMKESIIVIDSRVLVFLLMYFVHLQHKLCVSQTTYGDLAPKHRSLCCVRCQVTNCFTKPPWPWQATCSHAASRRIFRPFVPVGDANADTCVYASFVARDKDRKEAQRKWDFFFS